MTKDILYYVIAKHGRTSFRLPDFRMFIATFI